MNWYKKALRSDHPLDFDAQGNFYSDRFFVPSPGQKRELNFPKKDVSNHTQMTDKGLDAILNDLYGGDIELKVDQILSKWSENIQYSIHMAIKDSLKQGPIKNEESFAFGVANGLSDAIGDEENIADENIRTSLFHQIYNFVLSSLSNSYD